LAQGRLGLVRQASIEKQTLHRIAPHLAQPLAFVFPTYRSTQWPLWQMRLGVKIYDWLCGGHNFGKSSALSAQQVLSRIPNLSASGLTGAVRYFDALTNDARLVLDTLRSAQRHDARLLNYCRFHGAARQQSIWSCKVEDTLSGQTHDLTARTIVNATGPWASNIPHSQVKLRLTKGIHLVIRREKLPVMDAVVITDAKRLLFLIPWGERLIIGTTDADYQGSLDDVRAGTAEMDYLLHIVHEFFPPAGVAQSDVLATWAGLRPLLASKDGAPSDISRGHQIRKTEPGWWDVAGGKLTTYRLMAEQTIDQLVADRENGLRPKSHCRTADEPLLPVSETAGISGILPPPFGTEAVAHCCTNEWAIHLDDVMVRRTGWWYYHGDAVQKADFVADWMADLLGWSKAQREAELACCHALLPH
jgi:glycerol-3-phosphate dehydrogenase